MWFNFQWIPFVILMLVQHLCLLKAYDVFQDLESKLRNQKKQMGMQGPIKLILSRITHKQKQASKCNSYILVDILSIIMLCQGVCVCVLNKKGKCHLTESTKSKIGLHRYIIEELKFLSSYTRLPNIFITLMDIFIYLSAYLPVHISNWPIFLHIIVAYANVVKIVAPGKILWVRFL